MQSKIDATYIELRERILFGEFPAGTSMTFDDIVEHTGVSASMARQLLMALAVGGYVPRCMPPATVGPPPCAHC